MKKAVSLLVEFVKIWLFMFFSYLMIKTMFTWAYFGWIDVRRATQLEMLVLPTGQSIALWLIYRLPKRSKGDTS